VVRLDRFPAPGETVVGHDFKLFPGGKGANQAYAAARLGGEVRMVGQVGNDAQAGWLKQNLASAGVDVGQVRSDPAVSSGVATILIDRAGQNQIVIVAGANGSFSPGRLEESRATLRSAGLLLLQLEIPLDTVTAAAHWAKEENAIIILDPAPARSLPRELLLLADYLTPNESELAVLTGTAPGRLSRSEAAARARSLRVRADQKVIVKMGEQGALLVGSDREYFWAALPVQAVDTTAAGDAFNAGLAVALAEGRSEVEAGWFATVTAALSVTRPGAQPSMPTRGELEQWLRERRPAEAES